MSVGRAQFAHEGRDVAVAVFHIIPGGPIVAGAGVKGDIRFHAQKLAQGHKLVGANVVGLKRAPDGVKDRRALVGIADGVSPFKGGNVIAAGNAINAGVKTLENSDGVGPETVQVVGRHQGNRADVERTGAGGADFKSGGAGCGGFEREEEFPVILPQSAQRNGLLRCILIGTPDNIDGDPGAGIAGQFGSVHYTRCLR